MAWPQYLNSLVGLPMRRLLAVCLPRTGPSRLQRTPEEQEKYSKKYPWLRYLFGTPAAKPH